MSSYERAAVQIPFEDIELATKHFAEENLLKRGAKADVYKGILLLQSKLEIDVVIKRYKGYISHFYEGIRLIHGLRHRNVVSFIGICDERDEQMIVMEHVVNGSLVNYVTDPITLTWSQRLHICFGAALALKYWTDDTDSMGLFTKGFKILLNKDWEAKVVFVTGTRPWYETENATLGWILLEVMYGRKVTIEDVNQYVAKMGQKPTSHDAEEDYLDDLDDMIDPNLRKQMQKLSLSIFKLITYFCLRERPYHQTRVAISDIVVSLKEAFEIQWKHENFVNTRSERPTFEVVIKSLEKALHIQNALLDVQKLGLMKIPLKDIKSATESFDVKFLIGSGGYGSVYQGKLKIKRKVEHCDEPKSVAIKRIASRNDGEGFEGFLDELDVGRKCEHPNIISLIGFCVEDGEMLLVYELASNGSLEDYLEKNDKVNNLSWAKRLKMCIDIAQGLEYMHTTMEDKERIIHRDIKSANILLGKNWEAKIADFGLSKVYNGDKGVSTIKTIHVAGTPFYLDPEYAKTGRLKRASDIYSLGVVLFEIFSGKLAYNQTYTEENNKGLAPIAQRHFENGTLNKILDLKMMDEAFVLGLALKVRPDHHSLEAFSNIAYQCLASTQDKRPTIKDVIDHLKEALQFQENRMKPLKISLEHIKFGTENFSDEKSIRNGEYGMLYKGTIQDNSRHKEVVVKRFTSQEHGFLKEFEVLFKYKHENIIGLVGYCKEMDEKIIVYEHASMGSLDRYLKDTDLSWTKRLMICLDIAKGLKFLHEGDLGQDVVIHRDIRSSNILLNDDWKAKICGFEHALTYPTNQKNEYGIDIFEGSRGYSDPLFQKTRTLTKESDIYSFGVILFEILCGKLACPDDIRDHSLPLDVLVKSHYEAERLEEIVFEGIKKQIVLKSYATFQKIAFQCLQEKREERPTAGDVLVQLQQALEFQEAYEMRKAKLDRTYEEMLHEFSRSPEIYSTMRKKDIYNILSKGILHEDDKLVIKQTIWDLEQSALFIGKHDEDYHSEPEISLTIKTYPKKRQRRHMSRIAFNEETVASSSNITEQTPEKRTRHK
ncbi:hypothetical protein QVD17_03263 [Tagetes erecta]|uniref:non-specific serine/threonine protein kinase n=1 Tax=Tagetes erecta TaxID=13708 RepID=A0AAD8LFE5_TARER|nr:hypothetical protein QVD17_03263 [Tagetes erecta]